MMAPDRVKFDVTPKFEIFVCILRIFTFPRLAFRWILILVLHMVKQSGLWFRISQMKSYHQRSAIVIAENVPRHRRWTCRDPSGVESSAGQKKQGVWHT